MKVVLTFVSIMIFSIISAKAQDYTDYLQSAYKHLNEGNAEKAQKAYDVYRKLSGSIDSGFETALESRCKKEELMVTETNFPDPVFRKYVLDKFDINRDGKLSQYEIDEVTSIEVSVSPNKTPDIEKIASLKGVEYFTNLTKLACSGNKLNTLDITKNNRLRYLSCSSNTLTSLDVSKNTALEKLYCSYNRM